MKFRTIFFFLLVCFAASAQNGVGISVTGPTSVCANTIYNYQLQVVGTNVCYIAVSSNGGHKVTCNTAHNFTGTHATSDAGFYQSYIGPYAQGTIFPLCMHWVSSGAKSLCFTAYDCNANVISDFCITITNNSPAMVMQGNTNVCNGQYGYFTVTAGLSSYSWTVVPDNSETYSLSGGGCVANIGNLQYSTWHLVSASAVDCWGTTKYASKSFYTVSCMGGSGGELESRSGESNDLEAAGIRIYPNPVSQGGVLIINTENATVPIKQMQLFGLDGRLIQSGTPDELANSLTMPAQSGIYLLILTDETNRLYRRKVTVL